MISRPHFGQIVQLWYRASLRPIAPHHGRIGCVVAVASGRRCRNHAVLFMDGSWAVVPSGNLRKPAGRAQGAGTQLKLWEQPS